MVVSKVHYMDGHFFNYACQSRCAFGLPVNKCHLYSKGSLGGFFMNK